MVFLHLIYGKFLHGPQGSVLRGKYCYIEFLPEHSLIFSDVLCSHVTPFHPFHPTHPFKILMPSGFRSLVRTLHSPIDSCYFHLESTWTHGVHLESMWNFFGREPSQILSISTWIPPGFQMESTPFHITLHSNFHLSVDSTWTPPGLQQS